MKQNYTSPESNDLHASPYRTSRKRAISTRDAQMLVRSLCIAQEPQRVQRRRLVAGMQLCVYPSAHDIIMGYRAGQGPSLEDFSGPQPQTITAAPNHTTQTKYHGFRKLLAKLVSRALG